MGQSRPRRAGRVVAVAALAVPAMVGATSSPPTLHVRATEERGWIGLRIAGGVPRSIVSVREGDALLARIPLDGRGTGSTAHVARWLCSPRDRRLDVRDLRGAATTVTVRTPDCAHRLAMHVRPARPHAGGEALIRLHDRWHSGHLAIRICLVSAAGPRPCVPARLGPRTTDVRLRAPRPGLWRARVNATGLALNRRLVIRPGGAHLKVLAAGDSLMAPVAQALTDALGRSGSVRVRTDVILGAGLSDPWIADWRRRARRTARSWKPDIVVLFLGGADGFPFGRVKCCGAAYRAAYGARARRVAVTYSRHRVAQVYWLTLPAPQDHDQARLWRAENLARSAGLRGLEPWTRELDTSGLLTPGFAFRSTMPIDGRPTVIRESDGVHLTAAGGRLVAGEVTSALARDAIPH